MCDVGEDKEFNPIQVESKQNVCACLQAEISQGKFLAKLASFLEQWLMEFVPTRRVWMHSLRTFSDLRPRISGKASDIVDFRAPSFPAGNVRYTASGSQDEPQEVTWRRLCADTTKWWDDRWNRLTPSRSNFELQESCVFLWLPTGCKLVPELFNMGGCLKSSSVTFCTVIQESGACEPVNSQLEVGVCCDMFEDKLVSDAVSAISLLVQRGCHISNNIFYRLLKRCIRDKNLAVTRLTHALIVKSGYEGDAFLATHLIGLYASHGRLEEAMGVFTKVCEPDAHNWATIILAYARHGKVAEAAEAVGLYRLMCKTSTVKPDDRVYAAVLKACAIAGDLVAGKEVHGHVLTSNHKPDRFLQVGLLNMYAKCGSLEDARILFDKLPERDVVTWTVMIAAYAQHHMGAEALKLYNIMQQEGFTPPDSVTYVCLLKACAAVGVGALADGKELHAEIKRRRLQDDLIVGGSLVNMYAKCGSLQDAHDVFTKLTRRDVVTWTSIIAGYAQQGMGWEALSLYRCMQQEGLTPDSGTYVWLLQACANVGVAALDEGKQLHEQIRKRGLQEDVVLGCSLVNMYGKCERVEEARAVFDKLLNRDVATWTAMIAGYVQQGLAQEALILYRRMQQEGLVSANFATYVCLLQACANIGVAALGDGKQLHAEIKKQGLQDNVALDASLVNMYAKCGDIEGACSVFSRLAKRDVVTWTVMIAGYAQHGLNQEALTLYRSMRQEGLTLPDCVTYVCLLQACASVGTGGLYDGTQLHADIGKRGLQANVVLAASLVNMYAKCGSLAYAKELFDKLAEKTVIVWNAMFGGYVQYGMGQEALTLYNTMQQEGLTSPNCSTYVCLLQACANLGSRAFQYGRQLHEQITEQGLGEDLVLGGSLVNMYAKCGSLGDARRLFDRLPDRNTIAWNAMIAGYAQQGLGSEALNVYNNMEQVGLTPDSVTYVCLLQACASLGAAALSMGKQLHANINEQGLQKDVVLGVSLVRMYAKCGSLEDARSLFDNLPERNVVAWTTMIAGYAEQGMGQTALSLYSTMQREGLTPDKFTFNSLLQACASVGVRAVGEGKQLHARIKEIGLEKDAVLGGSLVNMHAQCGNMADAHSVFEKLPEKNLAAWNTMIAGYVQHGMGQDALSLYRCMQDDGLTPDSVTYACLLLACGSVGSAALDEGKQLHSKIRARGPEEELYLGVSLVNMYARCGCLNEARDLFGRISRPEKSIMAWNAMIAGYAQQGMFQEAHSLYSSMQQEGPTPNSVTYVCLLQACAAVAALPFGERLHAEMENRGVRAHGAVGVALINMYAKCGNMSESQRVFDSMSDRSLQAWGALISGYAHQGDSQVVFDLLDRMKLEGLRADEVVLGSVLLVCNHVGLVDKGLEYFRAMTADGIPATVDHFICIVDLLGRAGHLDEALKVVRCMPFSASDVVWRVLLGACRKWGNLRVAQRAFSVTLQLDENDAAAYDLMSNIYASTHMWEAANAMQARRTKMGVWKKPGQSWWIDVDERVQHTFLAEDERHPKREVIYAGLEKLRPTMEDSAHLES